MEILHINGMQITMEGTCAVSSGTRRVSQHREGSNLEQKKGMCFLIEEGQFAMGGAS